MHVCILIEYLRTLDASGNTVNPLEALIARTDTSTRRSKSSREQRLSGPPEMGIQTLEIGRVLGLISWVSKSGSLLETPKYKVS